MTTAPLPSPSSSLRERLDALFAPWNRTDAPGLAVGVARGKRVLYRRGFGLASIESGRAMSPTTRVRIGSTTKHFTALLALLLAEDGRLEMDTPIRRYLPELDGPGGDPTIRQLLQHRGGSRCYLDLGFIAHGVAIPAAGFALATQARQRERNFEPGAFAIYNNGGYHLVSIAAERVGGAPFEAQLRTRLFEPVGMWDTESIPSDLIIAPGVATLHEPEGEGWRRGIFPSRELRGEGAIVSTIDDMLRWTAHLRTRDRVGSPASWHALTERPTFPSGHVGSYALGLLVDSYRGAPKLHHAGGVLGGAAQMLVFPQHELDIVILSNGAPAANPVALAERVADAVLDQELDTPPPHVDASAHARLLGQWYSAETGMLYGFVVDGGALKLSLCGAPAGLPLAALPGGDLRCSPGSLGDLDARPQPDARDELTLSFCGAPTAYRRIGTPSADRSAALASAAGRYWCEDAECTLELASRDGELEAVFASPWGTVSRRLQLLEDTLAVSASTVGALPFQLVLAFESDGARVRSLQITTTRTRGLRFERREPPVSAGQRNAK